MIEPARTAQASAPSADRPSLLPREHGAYGQLAMPLVTGLVAARPSPAAFLLAAAFVLAFVAHEPLLILLGQRGRRLLAEEGPRATRLLAGLGVAALAAGGLGIALAPPDARIALVLPLVLGIGVSAFVWRKLEKTAAGEILVAAAFASCGAVVALSSGAQRPVAFAVALAWTAAFTAATMSVRAVLLRIKTKGTRDLRAAAAAGAIAVLVSAGALAVRAGLPGAVALSLAPFAAASIALAIVPIAPRRLKTVGWATIGTSVVTLAVLVFGLWTA